MKTCPRCKAQNSAGARFCIACSEYLMPEARKCPKGHTMDPTWIECAYCSNQNPVTPSGSTPVVDVGRTPTVFPSQSPSAVSQSGQKALPPPPPPGKSEPGKRRVTRFAVTGAPQPSAPEPPSAAKETGRKIVGVLFTDTWKPEGQIFPVREGRNLIGRDPEQCEIAIPQDQTLSSMNTHITYRRIFVVGDMVSMSGTDLNGEPVEQQFRPLPNYARIRTGSTYWTFIQIDSPSGQSAPGSSPVAEATER